MNSSPSDTPMRAAPPGRRRWRYLLVSSIVASAVLFVYIRYSGPRESPPGPPEVDLRGAEPSVVEAVERARHLVTQSPQSAQVWGQLGILLAVHDFHAPAQICFARAESLAPSDPR